MSATITADCPTVEAARPIGGAKPVFAVAIATTHPSNPGLQHLDSKPWHAGTPAPRHRSSSTPLRI
ncbi:MAG TPA: hypothetical protein VNT81_06925 [Vicinamibacterales bacterium]|nr:hypothetical protein [Vicinamibacterales bacterium]